MGKNNQTGRDNSKEGNGKRVKSISIGFIGQGWIGKNYSDDLEERGFSVVRYTRSVPYDKNREQVGQCDIVFIAVPTPTTPRGFDVSAVKDALKNVGKHKIAVIKSTMLPGTTEKLQQMFPDIYLFHSPEFLSEATARFDASHPERNIIGMPKNTPAYRARARKVLMVLPEASMLTLMCSAREAEIIKYSRNCFGYIKVVYMNLLYDLAGKVGADWAVVLSAIQADSMIANQHINPVHKNGRGAGGGCFIKDFEAFRNFYTKTLKDTLGSNMLTAIKDKNLDLLRKSGKNPDLIEGVYGTGETKKTKQTRSTPRK